MTREKAITELHGRLIDRDTIITYNNYYTDNVVYHCSLTPNISYDKLVPLICERCGGTINKETYKCEHCNTQYEWK